MKTIVLHSMLLDPLESSLCLFEKRLSVKNCTMNSIKSALPHSIVRIPKHEQTQMLPQDCYGSENSQSNSICDVDARAVHDLDSKFSINNLVDEMNSNEVVRSNSTSSFRGDNNNKDDDEEYMNYCSDDSELSVGKEVEDLDDDESRKSNDQTTSQLNDYMNRNQAKLPHIVRPNPTRQEDFLYKTHMYAEEIMKHQLNFMTVTKGLNISPKLNQNTFSPYLRTNDVNAISNSSVSNSMKIGFNCLQTYANDSDIGKKWSIIEDRNVRSPETTHFRQIHSHLNAISKITSALGRNTSTKTQITLPSNTTSRESSQSPPASSASTVHHMLNNNFNDSSLKFSIDNILKPSFGRRITDPLLKRNKPMRKSVTSQQRLLHTDIERTDKVNTTIESITAVSSLHSQKKSSPLHDQSGSLASDVPNLSSPSAVDHNDATTSLPTSESSSSKGPLSWPAWVYCTRYSDRPSSGPRARRPKKLTADKNVNDEKRPRTAFSGPQLIRLKNEFAENRYLTERRRQQLSSELGLNEAQIKIWFQNKRAKIKKSSGQKNPLALQLMAQGLYNHSTVPLTREEEELQEMQERANAEAEKTSNECTD